MTLPDDLEQRMRWYLQRRAPIPPPGALDQALQQTAQLPQQRRLFASAPLGWLVVGVGAAAALAIMLFVVRGALPRQVGPGVDGSLSASPTVTAAPSVTIITLPIPIREKAISDQALGTLGLRLQALGVTDYTSAAGDEMRFEMTIPPSVDPRDVDVVLRSVGRVQWLTWPDDQDPPLSGDPVPGDGHVLFDSRDVTSVRVASDPAGLEVRLTPTAAEVLANYTASHIGHALPLAMDGVIIDGPIIQSEITGGRLFISDARNRVSIAALAAILSSPPMPEGWTTPES